MCDDIDRAQDETQSFLDESLRQHARQRNHTHGRSACVDCDEPISSVRQKIGAVRCMECEQDERQRRFHDLTRGTRVMALQY